MSTDAIVICSESRGQVEESLSRRRYAQWGRGMKVSRRKIEYICVNGREDREMARIQGVEIVKEDVLFKVTRTV